LSVDNLQIFGAWFDHHEDVARPRSFEMTWREFVTEVTGALHIHEDKLATDGTAPGFSLARFIEQNGETRRANMYVDVLSAIVLDFDERFDPAVLFERLDCGIAWLAYTTFSHRPGKPRWRVIVPTATPIPKPAYKAARAWFLASIINKGSGVKQQADEVAKAVSNFYYLPGCPAEFAEHAEFLESQGVPLVLPPVSEFRRGIPAPRSLGTRLDWAFLHAKMNTYSKAPELRRAFKLALKGRPFCDKGNRNGMLFRMCGVLAGWATQAEPAELAAFFESSINAMTIAEPDDPPPSVADAAEMIARSQAGLLAQSETEAVQLADEAATVERPVPVEDDSFLQDALASGLANADELRHRLILCANKSMWVWRVQDHTWCGPTNEGATQAHARAVLPLVPGVDTWVRGARGGPRLKVLPELMYDYGEVIDRVSYTLRSERATYDVPTRSLNLAAAQRRNLTPAFHPFVAEWLEAVGGQHTDHLLDWLACIFQHDRAAQILFLNGSPGIGKGLLTRGLSRLWNVDGATDYVRISSSFNDDLLRCPLVSLDEGNWEAGAKNPTVFLRRLSAAAQHSINRKFQDPVDLSGYVRILMTMNNANLFTLDERALTTDDRDAIVERFMEIVPLPKARQLLDSIPFEERDALATEDHIARHVLWLRENRAVDSSGRYATKGINSRSFATRIVTMSQWGSWVVEWLARYLSDPQIVERAAGNLTYRDGTTVLVSPEAIVNTWAVLIKNKRPPLSDDISNALSSLSTRKTTLPSGKGTCFEVDADEIANWSEEKGIGNPNAIRINATQPALRSVKAPASVGEI